MKDLLKILIIILGIGIGVYVGFWLMFVGGIVQTIEVIKAPTLEGLPITIGISKIIFASFVGRLIVVISCILAEKID